MRLLVDSVARCAAAWHRERSDHAAERERAAAIAAPLRRAQFLAGRWLAAELLSQHAGGPSSQWQLSCVPGQAPRVLNGPGSRWPCVSIAHRDDLLACAVADAPVGVDVELPGRLRASVDELAAFVLSPPEQAVFAHTAAHEREAFLLARWTLKEAWAKRSGEGLSLGEMGGLDSQAVAEGGNARLWVAPGLVVACVSDALGGAPLRAHGLGLGRVDAQHWQTGPAPPVH